MTDKIEARIAALNKQIDEHIASTGFSVIAVFSDGETPAFSYTVGLTQSLGHPELIMFGLDTRTMQYLINDAVNLVKAEPGGIREPRLHDKLFKGLQAAFVPVDQENVTYLRAARARYGEAIQAMQILWPDQEGLFPWETGCDANHAESQPLLGRWPAAGGGERPSRPH